MLLKCGEGVHWMRNVVPGVRTSSRFGRRIGWVIEEGAVGEGVGVDVSENTIGMDEDSKAVRTRCDGNSEHARIMTGGEAKLSFLIIILPCNVEK